MKKAQSQTKEAVEAIKEATELNQKALADMTGASLATVKSWTKKSPSVMSDYFRRVIYYQLGARIQPDGSVKEWNGKHPYTRAHYRFWRRGFGDDVLNVPCASTPKVGGLVIRNKAVEGHIRKAAQKMRGRGDDHDSLIEARAVESAQQCGAVLRTLFLSALPVNKLQKNKLPGVWASFVEWSEKTAAEFGLEDRYRRLSKKEKLPAFLSYYALEPTAGRG